VLRRRPEAYHARLVALEAALTDSDEGGSAAGADPLPAAADAPASIHDLVRTREHGLATRLHYDAYERRSGLVHVLPPDTTPEAYATAAFRELGDFVAAPFELETLGADCVRLVRHGHLALAHGSQPLRVRKTVRFDGQRAAPRLALEVEVHNPGPAQIEARLAVEWSLTLLGGGGNPAAWYDIAGERTAHDGAGCRAAVAEVAAGNTDLGLTVVSRPSPPADAWWYSIDTVSLSEDGFERTHQGSCLSFLWPLRLEPGGSAKFVTEHHVSAAIDRAEVESG
jgi:alpha-amylase